MKKNLGVNDRLQELKKLINEHSRKYHALDNPAISDAEYDSLFQELIKLELENPDLILEDSPTQRVGSSPIDGFKKIDHLTQMLSFKKTGIFHG